MHYFVKQSKNKSNKFIKWVCDIVGCYYETYMNKYWENGGQTKVALVCPFHSMAKKEDLVRSGGKKLILQDKKLISFV